MLRHFLFRLRLSIRDIHTCQNAAGTCQEVRSNIFVQNQRGENHSGDRVEINPVGSFSQASSLEIHQFQVRKHIMDAKTAQEQEITHHLRLRKHIPYRPSRDDKIIRQDGKHTIEEDLAGNKKLRHNRPIPISSGASKPPNSYMP